MEKTKNIPKIRFKGYNDEWGKDKLSDLCDVRDGTHDSPKYFDYGYYFITSKNVKNGYVNFDDVKFISKEDYDAINKRSKVDVGDILFGVIGTIGNIALVKHEPNYAIKNVALIKDIDKIYNYYNYYCLQSQNVEKQLDFGLDGGTQKFLSLKSIRGLSINYPSIEEQKQIGSLFKNLDEKLEIEREKHEKLVNFKKAMLENVFPKEGEKRPKIRFGGYNDDWMNISFKDIYSEVLSGNRLPRKGLSKGSIPYVIASTVNNGVYMTIDKNTLDYNGNIMKKFKANSITFSIDNPEAIFLQKEEFYTSNIMRILYREDLDEYQQTFFMYSLKSVAKGYDWSIKFSGPVAMNSNFKVPAIDSKINYEEIRLIGNVLLNLDEKIQVSEEKISKIEKFKKAMMEAMFV